MSTFCEGLDKTVIKECLRFDSLKNRALFTLNEIKRKPKKQADTVHGTVIPFNVLDAPN